jgi:hypothetical protein
VNQDGPAYRRLPGASWWSPSKLYLGPDHLLIVQRFAFWETYWRFDLKDILACIVQRSSRRTALGFVSGGLLAFFVLIHLAVGESNWFLLIMELLLAATVIGNIAIGPSCNFSICTAVQQKPITCVRRTRNANALLAALRPAIEQAQGAMTNDELRQQLTTRGFLAPPTTSFAARAATGQAPAWQSAIHPVQTEPSLPYWGNVHLWLALTVLAGGVGSILTGLNVAGWIIVVPLVLLLAQIVLATVALTKQSHSRLPGGKVVPWLAILYAILAYFVFFFGTVFEAALEGQRRGARYDSPLGLWSVSESTGLIGGLIAIAIGIYALVQYASWQSLRKRQSAAIPDVQVDRGAP